ncbi:SDR family NAD(P)-dependent oxidoreductase [Erythrobacter alti]|uniref:SDR family NAD(P)-dependent oxidoreductase n=1 Tax=Erythrobacter alti TaxID=1896145 RepID=UPI0030F45D2D
MKLSGKTVVLTGAGSGIGRALAHQIARGGGRVFGCDIRSEGLDETRELLPPELRNSFVPRMLDVTDREAIVTLRDGLDEPVDCLVNCAGIIQPFVRFADLDDDAMERVFNVNWFGTLHMIRAFLPGLLERSEAQLVNVGSMSSIAPLPGQAIYGASKAAIKLLTETLYAEYLASNLQVTLVLPGAVATNISQNSGLKMPERKTGDNRPRDVAGAEDAARTIFAAIEAGEYRVLVDKMVIEVEALYRRDPQAAIETMARNFGGLLGD